MNEKFYKDGLRFTCIRCGKCCTIVDAIVDITETDINRIAGYLGLERTKFLKQYTHRDQKHRVLNDFPNGDCVFYDREKGCIIYDVRPGQCRTFPFWEQILFSKQVWDREALDCPGMNQGKLYTAEEIEKILDSEFDIR